MSVRDSQGRTNNKNYTSVGELLQEAVRRREESMSQTVEDKDKSEKKGKGLEFMALRLDVARKHLELAVTKKITPMESNILTYLEICTIGAQNSRSHICSKAEFYLEDIAKAMGLLKNKIYVHLKSLEKKGYITRERTRSKGREIIGLSSYSFGQILNQRQHEIERKRHLKLAVDNTRPSVDNSDPNGGPEVHEEDSNGPNVGHNKSRKWTSSDTKVDQNESQCVGITNENSLLDSSRCILDSFRGQNGNQETNVSEPGPGKTAAENARLIRERISRS